MIIQLDCDPSKAPFVNHSKHDQNSLPSMLETQKSELAPDRPDGSKVSRPRRS